MEPTINQQMPMPETKNKTWLWIIIMILVTGLSGTGIYYWQNMEAKKMAATTEEKVRSEMQAKITLLTQQLNEANSKVTNVENDLNNEKQKNTSLVDYKNFINNIQLQYPGMWNISAEKDGWLFSGADGHFWLRINDNTSKFDANSIKEDYYKNDGYGYGYEDSFLDIAGVNSYKQARYDLGVIEKYFIPKNNKIFNLDFEFNFPIPNEEKNKEFKDLINKIITSIKIN